MASRPSSKEAKRVGAPALVRGGRVEAEPGAGDDAERALGADEQLVEVGTDRGPRRPAGADAPAVGEGDVEAQHHVLDLPVAGRELAGRAARQPAADRGQRHRLRPVAEGERRARVRSSCSRWSPKVPGATSSTSDVVVDVDDAARAAEVEHHAAVQRHRGAAHAAAAGRRGDGDDGLVAHRQHLADLARRWWATRPRRPAPATCPSSAQIIAWGHQSRLASPSDVAVGGGGADRRQAVDAPRRAPGRTWRRGERWRRPRRRGARWAGSGRRARAPAGRAARSRTRPPEPSTWPGGPARPARPRRGRR